MDIDRTIAKLELKEMLNELLHTENVNKWTEVHLSQFLEYAEALLPEGPNCICFWIKYLVFDSSELLATGRYNLASRIELKRGYAVIVDKVPEDANDEDVNCLTQAIAEHQFFSMLKSAILEKKFFIPQFPLPQVDLMEMEILGRQVSFIPSENKTAFAKLIFDLIGLED